MSKVLFTFWEDKKLVEILAKYPCVYDSGDSVYKIQSIKDNSWKEIAEYVDRSVEDCKKRWRNIKDTYKKRQKRSPGTSSLSRPKPWALADMLTFLDKIDSERESTTWSIQNDYAFAEEEKEQMPRNNTSTPGFSVATNTNIDVPSDSTLLQPKKRKKHEKIRTKLETKTNELQDIIIENLVPNRDDDIDLFFKSIALSVKKLRPELINEAKMKSLEMLFDLESRNALISLPYEKFENAS